jgi:hypothetical protein
MSSRSIYLRDQAENLQWHANAIGDAETQDLTANPAFRTSRSDP